MPLTVPPWGTAATHPGVLVAKSVRCSSSQLYTIQLLILCLLFIFYPVISLLLFLSSPVLEDKILLMVGFLHSNFYTFGNYRVRRIQRYWNRHDQVGGTSKRKITIYLSIYFLGPVHTATELVIVVSSHILRKELYIRVKC